MGWDKLLLVGLLVGLVAGPERLLAWSRTAVRLLGRVRGAYQEGKTQVVGELDELAPDWRAYDPRQVDPRRIIRDALQAPPAAAPADPGDAGEAGGIRG